MTTTIDAVASVPDAPSDEGATSRGTPVPEGLYVHIPFCVSRCPYCDFVVYAGSVARGPRSRVDELIAALVREIELRADAVAGRDATLRAGPLGSVYVGGGTPSLVSVAQIARLLDVIDRRLGLAADAEITLEANPGADEIGDLAGFRRAGVTRLSIGAQSMDGEALRRLGRRHTPGDVEAAVSAARHTGIASLSLDLLTDVPGQTVETWRATLSHALDLGTDHLSVYSLALDDPDAEGLTNADGDHLPVTAGARRWRERARLEQSQERAAEMEAVTDELTSAVGLHRYEIANFARAGHQSRHNLLYWQRRPYLAVGPGAHASDGRLERSWNAARLDRYVEALRRGALPPGGRETIDAATAVAEEAMLGLRLSDGLAPRLAGDPIVAPGLAWAQDHGLAEAVGDRVRLTSTGRLLANEVFVRLLPGAHPSTEAPPARTAVSA